MFRLLAILAAAAPSVLLSLHSGVSCGWAPAAWPEPAPLRAAIWDAALWTVPALPAVLALLAVWAPRRFPVLGAITAAVSLAINASTLVIPHPSPCGPQLAPWMPLLCQAVVVVALLSARGERQAALPRLRALCWTGVVLIPFAGTTSAVLISTRSGSLPGCSAQLAGPWAEAADYLSRATDAGIPISMAAIGAVLGGRVTGSVLAVVLLVPALFEPVAQLVTSAPHDCSTVLGLVGWPYLVAAAPALATRRDRVVIDPAPPPG
ncbi:hypothetical protein ACGF0J_08985 [Nonomuraea sp. NPDC047897]|uniref:hypothetical protein n=1 Tax=Nonomuraea sp. NPDC047897 TaxID=3364346 RepID=UPI00370FBF5C